MFSIIVFSDRCELKKITVESPDVRVIHRERLYYNIKEIWSKYPDIVSDRQIKDIFERLKSLSNVDDSIKQEHIADIKRKYDKPAPSVIGPAAAPDVISREVPSETDMTTTSVDKPNVASAAAIGNTPKQRDLFKCPRCGSALVLRQAKRGQNAGNNFYGCSAFPKCRYIKNIE